MSFIKKLLGTDQSSKLAAVCEELQFQLSEVYYLESPGFRCQINVQTAEGVLTYEAVNTTKRIAKNDACEKALRSSAFSFLIDGASAAAQVASICSIKKYSMSEKYTSAGVQHSPVFSCQLTIERPGESQVCVEGVASTKKTAKQTACLSALRYFEVEEQARQGLLQQPLSASRRPILMQPHPHNVVLESNEKGWRCNGCRVAVARSVSANSRRTRYRCVNDACDFDLCASCVLSSHTTVMHEAHLHDAFRAAFMLSSETSAWICDVCEARYQGGRGVPTSRFTCAWGCDYDICGWCFGIEEPQLTRYHAHPLLLVDNKTGWSCDVCRNPHDDDDKACRLRCEACDYDVCRSCFGLLYSEDLVSAFDDLDSPHNLYTPPYTPLPPSHPDSVPPHLRGPSPTFENPPPYSTMDMIQMLPRPSAGPTSASPGAPSTSTHVATLPVLSYNRDMAPLLTGHASTIINAQVSQPTVASMPNSATSSTSGTNTTQQAFNVPQSTKSTAATPTLTSSTAPHSASTTLHAVNSAPRSNTQPVASSVVKDPPLPSLLGHRPSQIKLDGSGMDAVVPLPDLPPSKSSDGLYSTATTGPSLLSPSSSANPLSPPLSHSLSHHSSNPFSPELPRPSELVHSPDSELKEDAFTSHSLPKQARPSDESRQGWGDSLMRASANEFMEGRYDGSARMSLSYDRPVDGVFRNDKGWATGASLPRPSSSVPQLTGPPPQKSRISSVTPAASSILLLPVAPTPISVPITNMSGQGPAPVHNHRTMSIEEFLQTLSLPQYTAILNEDGCDDTHILSLYSEEALRKIGVKQGHVLKIHAALKSL